MEIFEALTFDDVLLQPGYSEVLPSDVDVGTQLLPGLSLKIPVLSAAMDTVTEHQMAIALGRLGGLGVIHKNFSIQDQAREVRAAASVGVQVGAAIGVGSDSLERAGLLVENGACAIFVDSAHGHSRGVLETVTQLRRAFPKHCIVGGNVATSQGTLALIQRGADAVKVGIGPGSICTTRIVSGVGVPQLYAISRSKAVARLSGTAIIADGGIKASGDVVKALAIGANAVMLGSMLAGTDEAPGEIVEVDGKKFKQYRGMGSIGAMERGSKDRYFQAGVEKKKLVAEGVEGLIPYKGSVADVIFQLIGGLRAGMGYVGAQNLKELQVKAEFVRITPSGLHESHPHTVKL